MTEAACFYKFEIDISNSEIESAIWNDVTSDFPVNAHTPGIEKTVGFLALDVLKELNDAA